MCGEQPARPLLWLPVMGSSPRVRGAEGWQEKLANTAMDHPRVCGEQTRDPQLTITHPSQRLTFQSVCERAVT